MLSIKLLTVTVVCKEKFDYHMVKKIMKSIKKNSKTLKHKEIQVLEDKKEMLAHLPSVLVSSTLAFVSAKEVMCSNPTYYNPEG